MKTYLTLLIAYISCTLVAADKTTDDGFISLFDGNSLDGWHLMNGADFVVKDGVIRHLGGLGWMRSDKQYTDFIFRIEFRFLAPRQDGGIFIRATKEGEKWPKSRYEVQVENSERMARLFGTEYDLDIPLTQQVLKPIGQWNHYEITVKGSEVRVVLNGKLVCTSDKLTRLGPGFVGLQGEDGAHEYRNILIKELHD